MRLNKYIALSLGVSRRQADDMIQEGPVLINGEMAELGAQVKDHDVVAVHGRVVQPKELQYIALNKPTGYVCSRKAQGEFPTIYDLLPDELRHLKTAGRLDKDSSGLILLSNDGDFTHKMTHPTHQKEKVYYVETDVSLNETEITALNRGIELEDGFSKLGLKPKANGYEVRMSEGRNRQIRRTFSALGKEVTKLHRLQVGDYSLQDLAEGAFRPLEV